MSEQNIITQEMWQGAINRALKAEKAFLKLKFDNFIEKMQEETSKAEKDYTTKLPLYNNLPDQKLRLDEEFQMRTQDINRLKDAAKEIHQMLMEALDKGLCMDELPLTSTNTFEVKSIIQKLLGDKEFRNNGTTVNDNKFRALNITDTGNNQQHAFIQDYNRQAPRASNGHTGSTNGNMSAGHRLSANNGTTNSFPPQQRPSPITTFNTQNSQAFTGAPYFNSQLPDQMQRFRPPDQSNMRSMPQNPMHYQQSFFSNGAVSKPSAAPTRPNAAVGHPYKSNNLGYVARQPTPRLPTTTPPFPSATVTSPIGTRPAVSQSMTASAVNDLDNFVIEDDDLFSQTSPNANLHNGAPQKPLETTNKLIGNFSSDSLGLDSLDTLDDEYTEDQSSRTEDNSISDDEEFARNMSHVQGAKAPAAATNVAVKPKPSKDVTEIGAGKADPAEDEINWSDEPWLSIAQQLMAKYRVNKKVSTQALESAVRKVGGITDLDAVWAEAERSVQNALKPSPLQPAVTKAMTTAASKPTSAVTKATIATPNKAVTSTSTTNANKSETGRFSNYKTVMCKNWLTTKKCPMGDYCTFAHGKGDLRPSPQLQAAAATKQVNPAPNSFFKVIMCRNYEATKECRWGDNCIFAHGADELRRPSAEDSLREDTSSTSSAGHTEPCDNQQCPGKLNYLLRKTGLCEKNKEGLCTFGKDCKFAHSRKELKPMPKWEMCQRNVMRKCIHSRNPEKCVYAHSKEELRKKPADLESTSKPVGQATGGRPIPKSTRYVPWAGEDKHPATPKDGEECAICMGPLMPSQKKNLLKCGHNNFHERCISQWVNEGMPSCPICREPAKVPDMFKAPAGFQPEEFPGLGL